MEQTYLQRVEYLHFTSIVEGRGFVETIFVFQTNTQLLIEFNITGIWHARSTGVSDIRELPLITRSLSEVHKKCAKRWRRWGTSTMRIFSTSFWTNWIGFFSTHFLILCLVQFHFRTKNLLRKVKKSVLWFFPLIVYIKFYVSKPESLSELIELSNCVENWWIWLEAVHPVVLSHTKNRFLLLGLGKKIL